MDDPQDDATVEQWIERCRRLAAENQYLRAHLAGLGIDLPRLQNSQAHPAAPHRAKLSQSALNTAQKIALFRSLFRGREDVYLQNHVHLELLWPVEFRT